MVPFVNKFGKASKIEMAEHYHSLNDDVVKSDPRSSLLNE